MVVWQNGNMVKWLNGKTANHINGCVFLFSVHCVSLTLCIAG